MVDFKAYNAQAKEIKALLIKDWRAHAKLWSPSNSDRWLNCAGSVLANKDEKDDGGNKASWTGTAAHALLEVCLKYPNRPPASMVGWMAGEAKNPIAIDDHMAESVDYALTYIKEVQDAMVDPVLYFEQEVSIEETGDNGHLDVSLWDAMDSVLHVFDYKNGRHQVDAEENTQMLLYLMGMIQKLKINPRSCVLHIIQPNAGVKDSKWTVPAGYLARFARRVADAVAAGTKPGAPFVAGGWCSYCPQAGVCPALAKRATEACHQDFKSFIDKPVTIAASPARLTDAQVAQAYLNLDVVEVWRKAISARVLATLARDGNAMPGLKLVAGKSNREWEAEENVRVALSKLGLKPDEYAPRKLVGIGAAETLLKKVGVKPQAREGIMKNLTKKPNGKPQVAPASDPRPALANSVLIDFADLIENPNE